MPGTTTLFHRSRVQRSELAVPATSGQFFQKAIQGPADVIFLDLEDAVADAMKTEARGRVVEALNTLDWGHKTVVVRVNGLDTPWGQRDILEVAAQCPRLDMILLPKVACAFDVCFVDRLLAGVEQERGSPRRIGLEVLIETAQGVAHAEEIAGASARLEAMVFGVGDYTVDMRTWDTVFGVPSANYAVLTAPDAQGMRVQHWNDQWHFAMARIANACRAHGLRAIDGPYTDFRDADGYRASARRALAQGFEGKWAIHPSQVALANEVFTPGADQVAWARSILDALRAANTSGAGAFQSNGVLIDLAHRRLAESLLACAARIEAYESEAASAR